MEQHLLCPAVRRHFIIACFYRLSIVRGRGRQGGLPVNKAEKIESVSKVFHDTGRGTKVALWWLKHYETVMPFWRGFSWTWVIGILLAAIVGYLDLGSALLFIFFFGVIANTGMYLGIRTLSSHLKNLENGPEKEEAHELMIKIIQKTVLRGA